MSSWDEEEVATAVGSVTTETKRGKAVTGSTTTNVPFQHPHPFEPTAASPVAATVGLGMGLTLNLGGFEMARIDVRLDVPCNPARVGETYEAAKQWVTARLQEEVQSVRKGARG